MDDYDRELIANLYLLPVRMAGTYSLIYFILPFYLFKRKYELFGISLAAHAFLYGFGIWLVQYSYCYCPDCLWDYHGQASHFSIYVFFASLIANYEIPAIAAAIVIFKKWFLDQQHARGLEKEKLEAELKFLKGQIHPHFLFNTLNNLYALTLKKSDKAPDLVIKLSEMLDYMLYNSNEKEVKLSDEIKQIENYLELEKIRYGNRLKLNISLTGNVGDKFIAPLLLLPFIENSFKHGVSGDIDNPFVNIELKFTDICLKLKVSNSFNPDIKTTENYCEGIGLKNAKRRLELLYPERHELKIEQEQNIFNVYLCIAWTENPEDCRNI